MTDIPQQRFSSVSEQTITEDEQIDGILKLVTDSDCRKIMTETKRAALSAEEISDHCDISLSTVYRKIDDLVAWDILEERIRVTPDIRHVHEYILRTETLEMTVTEEHGISVTVAQVHEPPANSRRSTFAD